MTQFISLSFNQIGSTFNMLHKILFCSYKKSLDLIGYLEEEIMTTSKTLHYEDHILRMTNNAHL